MMVPKLFGSNLQKSAMDRTALTSSCASHTRVRNAPYLGVLKNASSCRIPFHYAAVQIGRVPVSVTAMESLQERANMETLVTTASRQTMIQHQCSSYHQLAAASMLMQGFRGPLDEVAHNVL
mmetsp:Transcript_58740/g.102798  ORF Transcript_58740/g.102798 Transcript_58740/m.102798 type:complete len:122 (-) Transcript_58740:25-390(-)